MGIVIVILLVLIYGLIIISTEIKHHEHRRLKRIEVKQSVTKLSEFNINYLDIPKTKYNKRAK